IDIEHRGPLPPHERVTYLKGSSTDTAVVTTVKERVRNGRVMVILDSDHTANHVYEELATYAPLVHPGGYLIVEDTNINGHPTFPEFGPGPMEAVDRFLAERGESFLVDEACERFMMTLHPKGYLRRKEQS